jgi:transposase-like protein
MPRISEAKRAAILQDYIAGKMTIVAICRKYGVSDDQPRLIAKAGGVWRSTRAWRGRKKAAVALKHRPPKINPEQWAAACAKRARHLAEVGPFPERALHPERYGNPPASDDGLTAAARGMRKLREQRREARAS